LIEKLGSPKFVEREEAAKRLEAIGGPAIDGVRKAARIHPDAEVRRRAETLLSRMERLARPGAVFGPPMAVPGAMNRRAVPKANELASRWRDAYAQWQKGSRRTEDMIAVIAEVAQAWSDGIPDLSPSVVADETEALLAATMAVLDGKRNTVP